MISSREIKLRQDNKNGVATIDVVITSEHSPNVLTDSTLSIKVPLQSVQQMMDSIQKSATDFVDTDKINSQPKVDEDAERRIADMLK